ncbi:MAG: FAD binding domain-containing protein [Desulforhopalus sp.]
MHQFSYKSPSSLDEAIALLQRDARSSIIAGGTDLIVEIKEEIRQPDCLVDINRIPDLSDLHYDKNKGLTIGALTRVRTVEQSPDVKAKYPGLYHAVSQLGSVQIRNRATVIGNICRASPSADTPPPLIAAGASVTILGPKGIRKIDMQDFFTGPGQTVLKNDELVTHISIPPPPPQTGALYLKLGRRKAMELATAGVAVSLTMNGEICSTIRIVLGAVAPTPIRAKKAEDLIAGTPVGDREIALAAKTAMAEASPISDVRSSAEYRREMVGVLTEQAINEARQIALSQR